MRCIATPMRSYQRAQQRLSWRKHVFKPVLGRPLASFVTRPAWPLRALPAALALLTGLLIGRRETPLLPIYRSTMHCGSRPSRRRKSHRNARLLKVRARVSSPPERFPIPGSHSRWRTCPRPRTTDGRSETTPRESGMASSRNSHGERSSPIAPSLRNRKPSASR